MASFSEMKKLYSTKPQTIGQRIKVDSDSAMQKTWQNDPATRLCYLYDFYHDSDMDKMDGYDPSLAPDGYKVPVWLKFIIKDYKSAAKDDPEYHIQFSPDDWNAQNMIPNYFGENYGKFDVRFPIGLYVDIPDDRGIYHRFLIFYDEVANQFPKFGVIKCNYKFQWVVDKSSVRYLRSMWGAQRTQNSLTRIYPYGALCLETRIMNYSLIDWKAVKLYCYNIMVKYT